MLALSPETEALVRNRAVKTGKTPDQVIREALGPTDYPAEAAPDKQARLDKLIAIAELASARPVLDPRPADVIAGYGDRRIAA